MTAPKRNLAMCHLVVALIVISGCSSPSEFEKEDSIEYDVFCYLRDYQYHARTFYDVGKFGREDQNGSWEFRLGADSIIDFKLFVQGASQASDDPYANMYIDPTNIYEPEFRDEIVKTNVRELSIDEDYYLNPSELWIRLEHQLRQVDFLAYWMKVQTPDSLVEIGSLGAGGEQDTLLLKLLKSRIWSSGSSTWEYEWKNVYYLGAKNLAYSDFMVEIYKGVPGSEEDVSNLNYQEGVLYLQIFGLDVYDENGNLGVPDGNIDNASWLLDLQRGYLIFPDGKPFAPDYHIQYLPNLPPLANPVPEIYAESNPSTLRDHSKYYLKISFVKDTTTAW
jgi:cell surface protein SprA